MQFIRLDNKSINNAYSPLQLLILPWFPPSAHPPLSSNFVWFCSFYSVKLCKILIYFVGV
jgi:hypothetical protein